MLKTIKKFQEGLNRILQAVPRIYQLQPLGKAISLSESELELLRISGIFHDVGKISTADDFLSKSAGLSADEYSEIMKHPLKGAQILSAVSMFKNVVPIVQCHHERMDGKGYPFGVKGDAIPLFSRIISVVDAFDAMTSDRQYRSRMDLEHARTQLLTGRGTQFDARLIDMFLDILENYDEILLEMERINIGTDSYLISDDHAGEAQRVVPVL